MLTGFLPTNFLPHWFTALASAFDLASPYALLLLPLPLLAARLMPPCPPTYGFGPRTRGG